jgi:MFS family permease
VLAVLLVAGSLSDHIGRRPMMTVALAAEAGAAWLFLSAHGIGALYAGRVLQGVATAGAATAVGAALLDLQPSHRPTLASTVNATASSAFLAVGALGAGILVHYAPAPTTLVFWVLLAASLAGLLLVVLMAEPGERRPLRWAVLRPRAGIPPVARRAFLAALPALIATWGLGGFYFSLVPTLTEELARSSDTVWGGAAIFLLSAPAAIAGFSLRQLVPGRAMVVGCTILAVGSAATVGAIVAGSTAGLLLSTTLAGIGFGLGFLGAFRHLARLAPDDQRGALVATIYIVSYLAFSLPVIAAGVAATRFPLRDIAIIYGAAVAGLSALAAVAGLAGWLNPAQPENPQELASTGCP